MKKLDDFKRQFEKEADQSHKDKTISEQMRTARSAKNAAWIAAIAAIISAIIATIIILWKNH